jgi:hypothetical protein
MPELASLQALFSAAMADRARDKYAVPLIAGDAELARRRLAVYRANIAANAVAALAAIYPIVRKLVGDEFFAGLAHAYCAAHPSASGDLNELGGHLAAFLPAFAPARELPYLADVARLEWLVHQAHYAADHPPLALEALSRLAEADYPRLAVKLHPAVALAESAFPLFRIWEVHQEDFEGEVAVDLDSGAGYVVVYRPQFRATVAGITPAEAQFLKAVQGGSLFGAALDLALGVDAGFNLALSLKEWGTSNIVVAIESAEGK